MMWLRFIFIIFFLFVLNFSLVVMGSPVQEDITEEVSEEDMAIIEELEFWESLEFLEEEVAFLEELEYLEDTEMGGSPYEEDL